MDETYARLIWVTEQGPHTYLLNPGQVVTLGREPNNGITIPLGSISRKHAQIEWNGSSYVLSDLGSANGTYVNGKRLGKEPWVLRDGDIIKLHILLIRFKVIMSTEDPFDFAPDAREDPQLSTRQSPRVTSKLDNPEEESEDSLNSQLLSETIFMPLPQARCLVIKAGPHAGNTFDLTEPIITIGYAAQGAVWDILLDDPNISQPHARLEMKEEEYQLSDLHSTTGTYLNNECIAEPTLLKEGDEIVLGTVRLVYRGKASHTP